MELCNSHLCCQSFFGAVRVDILWKSVRKLHYKSLGKVFICNCTRAVARGGTLSSTASSIEIASSTMGISSAPSGGIIFTTVSSILGLFQPEGKQNINGT